MSENRLPDPNARRGEYLVPGNARVTRCACGAQIAWGKTHTGADIPLSLATVRLGADGQRYALNHFADCSQAARYRKPRGPSVDRMTPAGSPATTGVPVDLRDLPDYLERHHLVVIGSTIADDGNGKLLITLQTRRQK